MKAPKITCFFDVCLVASNARTMKDRLLSFPFFAVLSSRKIFAPPANITMNDETFLPGRQRAKSVYVCNACCTASNLPATQRPCKAPCGRSRNDLISIEIHVLRVSQSVAAVHSRVWLLAISGNDGLKHYAASACAKHGKPELERVRNTMYVLGTATTH